MININIKYCNICGKKLKFTKTLSGYNPENGEENWRVRGRCPDAMWYNNHASGLVRDVSSGKHIQIFSHSGLKRIYGDI